MRNLMLFGYALVAVLAVSSCQDGLAGPGESGAVADVTFCVNVEGETLTRAISDGTGADQLMWAVFTEDGELVISKTVKDNVTDLLSQSGHTISLSLARGKTYKASFWAQNSACEAYDVSDDMKVTVDYEGVNNDEARDAFFVTSEPFTAESGTTVSVVLKRPFAQVNVGAFPWDLEYAVESGMDVALSGATIKGVANVIDLFDGTLEGEVEVAYSVAAIPAEKLMVDVDENGTMESYDWLSMSYILAGVESTTHEMAFTFSELDGAASFTFDSGLGSVPVQRNWRTNIVGQILTDDISFNIKIDPVYEGETINSGGLYYNFSDDVEIKDKEFVFNTPDAATFTSENNTLIAMENVEFSGKVQYIAIGDYRDKGKYVSYTNELKNVVSKDVVVTHSVGIANVETVDYMAPLFFLRGVNTVVDCEFTGTTSIAPEKKDWNGNMHPVLPYDVGVPNACEATFENTVIDRLYAWSHSKITLNKSKVKYIRCSTHKESKPDSHLTIGPGTEVEEIFVTSTGLAKFVTIDGKRTLTAEPWPPHIIIKAGAKVNKIDFNGRSDSRVEIEDGAVVGEIVNVGE